MTLKSALLLIGSPKPKGGTSMVMAEYLASRLREINVEVEIKHIHQAIDGGKEDDLFEAVDRAEAAVLLSPLYVDSLPSGVIHFFELFLERKGPKGGKGKPLYAIINSGFPESVQSTVALEICVLFARDTGFTWNGGGALGAGPILEGKTLEESGGRTKNLRAGLALLAVSMSLGGGLSKQARDLIGRPLVPKFLYVYFSNKMWKKTAEANGVGDRLYDRPLANK
ncbi:MAG TPA: NAD(P)H-dependent oxidoreductase [Methanomassiliicoccales archaeon]|jgi:multimeric flavodoxin WrbA